MDIPNQVEGNKSDNEASCEAVDAATAGTVYKTAVERLLHVNAWKDFSGFDSATFQLCDEHGKPVEKMVEKGDYIRIDIPGPGSKTGDGYDWVRVKDIMDTSSADSEELQMTVEPSANPLKPGDDTAHFFASGASSSFVITRMGKTITAGVHGRNEKPNKDTDRTLDNVRNRLVAGGAFGGLADIQWTNLAEGLLEDASRAR